MSLENIARLDDVNQGSVDFLIICPFITQVIKQIVAIIDTKRSIKHVSNLLLSSVSYADEIIASFHGRFRRNGSTTDHILCTYEIH